MENNRPNTAKRYLRTIGGSLNVLIGNWLIMFKDPSAETEKPYPDFWCDLGIQIGAVVLVTAVFLGISLLVGEAMPVQGF